MIDGEKKGRIIGIIKFSSTTGYLEYRGHPAMTVEKLGLESSFQPFFSKYAHVRRPP